MPTKRPKELDDKDRSVVDADWLREYQDAMEPPPHRQWGKPFPMDVFIVFLAVGALIWLWVL